MVKSSEDIRKETLFKLFGECIKCPGFINKKGYGWSTYEKRQVKAHRAYYCRHHGISLKEIEGLIVRHKCDNPSCVNPLHLELGTIADNNRDRDERGRATILSGENSGTAKLSDLQVKEIRSRYKSRGGKNSGASLAREFKVSRAIVCLIVTNKHRNNCV